MKIIEKVVPNNFNYFLCGDNHEGNILQYQKGIDKFFDMLESEWNGVSARYNYAWHHGDHIEAITVDDPRYDPRVCENPIPMEQNENFIKRWKPVARKFIGMNEGNHPWKLHRMGNLTRYACDRLKIEYGTFRTVVVFRDRKGEILFRSFHTHGRKLIRSVAEPVMRRLTNMRLTLQRQLSALISNAILCCKGHTHLLFHSAPTPVLYMREKNGKIVQGYTNPDQLEVVTPLDDQVQQSKVPKDYIHPDDRWYVNTGSFLRTIGEDIVTYQEAFEYPPTNLGFAIVEVRDRKIVDIKDVVL